MAKEFLLRLKLRDTPIGVSKETLEKLSETLNLSKTDTIHLALANLAGNYLPDFPKEPAYEPDDGPLTAKHIEMIRRHSSASHIPDECFTNRLFS